MKRMWALMAVAGVVLSTSGCEREKNQVDAEVRRLCKQDGGISVHETIVLSGSSFDKFGVVQVPLRRNAKPSDAFFYEWETTYIKRGNPEMWRNHFRLTRVKDGKLLGEVISYTRRGGDLPGPWHESSFTCPPDGDISTLKQRVFAKTVGGPGNE